jgi:hypothetical protein
MVPVDVSPALWTDADFDGWGGSANYSLTRLDARNRTSVAIPLGRTLHIQAWGDGVAYDGAGGVRLLNLSDGKTFGPFVGGLVAVGPEVVFTATWDQSVGQAILHRHSLNGTEEEVWKAERGHYIGPGGLSPDQDRLAFTTTDTHISAAWSVARVFDLPTRTLGVGFAGSWPSFITQQDLLFTGSTEIARHDLEIGTSRVIRQGSNAELPGAALMDADGSLWYRVQRQENLVQGVHGWHGDLAGSRIFEEDRLLVDLREWRLLSFLVWKDGTFGVVAAAPGQ